MATINQKIVLASRPVGMVSESNFRLVEEEVRELNEGEVLFRAQYLSVDPYMRGRMNDTKSYADPVGIGEVMTGEIIGPVESSKNPRYKEGDIVAGRVGWQKYAISDGKGLRKIKPSSVPISTSLGVLGMPGLTAYFGLLDVCQAKEGDTVVVSGAAGAVGSVVGQIAKIKGCRVVGIAGSDDKLNWITEELGFDAGINYKTSENITEELKNHCPQGVNCYFDNVGGPITDAVFPLLALNSHIAICGQISMYNSEKGEKGPRLLWNLIVKRATIQGFLVFDYFDRFSEAMPELTEWVASGKIKYRENVIDGLENAPRAFIGLFKGENTGKQLVRIS
ncbi:MAG: NADP-dependent oxidoreductase [Verrucomicrobia bacterium]|nr:NADP-dependent oxidoreductase [Verrucomicrobiota bacterium]